MTIPMQGKMKRFAVRSVFYLFALLAMLLHLGGHAQPGHKEVRSLLSNIMEKEHIPGLAYAVVRDGKVETMGVLGKAHLGFNQNVTRQTVFQLASCSKLFCSLLLGKLFDNGLLHPQQTLGALLDSVPTAWKGITIMQLAAHQSGIKMADFSKSENTQMAFAAALTMPLEYEPGTRDAYVSSDYWVLQYLIEKVTGLKYFDALRKYVLMPLGLNHTFVNNPKTGFITDLDIVPQQAQEYHWFPEDSTLRISQMWFGATGYAAGGIYSSIEDLAKVAVAFDRGNFISPATRTLLSNPVVLQNGQPGSFGLGLIVKENEQGHKMIGHSGGPALADFVRFDRDKLTFIVLTNNRGVYPYLARTLATLYIKGLQPPKMP